MSIEDDGVALLKMNDDPGKNIFSKQFIDQFLGCLDRLESTHKPSVLVLHGLSDVFSGGGDKQALLDLCDGKASLADLTLTDRLLDISFPVIAAMEGHAIGGGLLIGVCCDIVIAARESRYGAVFMNMGFTPGMGCTKLLELLVGPYVASEMMLTGKRFRGSELAGKGTNINYILPKTEVMPKARDIALQIAEKNVDSLHLLKRVVSARKKKLMVEARMQEDLMHRLSFSFPETRDTIQGSYVGK